MSNLSADPFPGLSYPGPPVFEANPTPYKSDYACASIAAFFAVLLFSSTLATDFTHLRKIFKYTAGVFLGAIFTIILITICSRSWVQDTVVVRAQYKGFSSQEVDVRVGLHVGQVGINVTMLGLPRSQAGETIDYNEDFSWASPSRASFSQGRNGFSAFANRLNQALRRSQFDGIPIPILAVAEWFSFDGDGIRWGRYYRLAGYYAFVLEYTALGFFAIAVLFGVFRLRLGAVLLMTSGAVLASAAIVYAILLAWIPVGLSIPVGVSIPEAGVEASVQRLEPHLSWAFWLTLGTGVVMVVVSGLVYVVVTAAETHHRLLEEDETSADFLEKMLEKCVPKRWSVAVYELLEEH